MSFVLCALLTISTPQVEQEETIVEAASPSAATETLVAPDWTVRQWRKEVGKALRAHALADGVAKEKATHDLFVLHEQLRNSKLRGADVRVMGKSLASRLLRARGEMMQAIADGQVGAQLGDNPILAQFGRPAPAPAASGEASLCELIETTIDPDSWERVGGNGTIVPWSPFRGNR